MSDIDLSECVKSAIELFRNGLNLHQISEKLGINYDVVKKYLIADRKFKFSVFAKLEEAEINEILRLIDSGYKVYEISEKFNLDRHTVIKVLNRYGRISEHSKKKFNEVRRVPFSEHHKDIIVGTLLGDGCIHKQRKNSNNLYKYYLSHSKKQEEYFLWKFEQMRPFITKYYEVKTTLKSNGKTYDQLKSTSIAHPEFKRYYEMFYDKNGIKFIPNNIDLYLNKLTMAIWFMDDGSLNSRSKETKGSGLKICSLGFTLEDNQRLMFAIKACFGINVKIGVYNRNGKPYYYLSFNKRNSWLLRDLIYDDVIPSMKYKLNLIEQ